MVAELTAWIMLKALFFLVVIFGPIALVGFAIDNRLKKTPNGAYVAAVSRFVVLNIALVALALAFVWAWWHHQPKWPDYFQGGVIIMFLLTLRQDWQRVRRLTQERRQAKALADAANDQPSEFQYASEIKRWNYAEVNDR